MTAHQHAGCICLLSCSKTDAWRRLPSSHAQTEGRLELYTGISALQFITELRNSLCHAVLCLLSEEKFRSVNGIMKQVLLRSKTEQDFVLGKSLIICFFSAVCFSCIDGSTASVKINRFVTTWEKSWPSWSQWVIFFHWRHQSQDLNPNNRRLSLKDS